MFILVHTFLIFYRRAFIKLFDSLSLAQKPIPYFWFVIKSIHQILSHLSMGTSSIIPSLIHIKNHQFLSHIDICMCYIYASHAVFLFFIFL
jgi:hypothetical protein